MARVVRADRATEENCTRRPDAPVPRVTDRMPLSSEPSAGAWTLGRGAGAHREGPGRGVRRYRGQVVVGTQQARRIAAVLIAASLALLAGCTGSSSDASSDAAPKTSSTPAQLTLSLADGAVDVAPTTPLEVTVTGGELGAVTVADSDGAEIAGSVEPSADD